jgi:hypothetical protein
MPCDALAGWRALCEYQIVPPCVLEFESEVRGRCLLHMPALVMLSKHALSLRGNVCLLSMCRVSLVGWSQMTGPLGWFASVCRDEKVK